MVTFVAVEPAAMLAGEREVTAGRGLSDDHITARRAGVLPIRVRDRNEGHYVDSIPIATLKVLYPCFAWE
jgi:pantoate kinase